MAHLQTHKAGEEDRSRQGAETPAQVSPSHPPVSSARRNDEIITCAMRLTLSLSLPHAQTHTHTLQYSTIVLPPLPPPLPVTPPAL